MSKTPAASTRSSSRTVRERQLVLIDDPRQYLKSVDAHELQVDDDWEERLNLQVKIMNVVGTVDLKTPLDLKVIALHARNAEYNPKRFSAVIMRLRDPKTTALIFGSGKLTLIECNIGVRNVMGTCDVRFPIRLEGLLNDHARFSSYEPELFPGLIYKLVEPKLTLLIFVSGKIVLCGARDSNHLHQAIDKMYPVLLQYRKMTAPPSLMTGKRGYEDSEDLDRLEAGQANV
uniref:TATA-box-binding protein n=1 Tax=Hyaloperonospora arabidopsidis (strain Emoy2) TaxID=559515 RepID=M4C3Q3_HYAAE